MLCIFIPRCGFHSGRRMKLRRRNSTPAACSSSETSSRNSSKKRKRRKEDISPPIPLLLDADKMHGFQVNNNMFLLEGCGSSIVCSSSTDSRSQQTPSTGRCAQFTDTSSAGEPLKFSFSPNTVASYRKYECFSPKGNNLGIITATNKESYVSHLRLQRGSTDQNSYRDELVSDSDQTGHSELDSWVESSPHHSYTPLPPKPPRMKQYRTFVCQNSLCGKEERLLGHTEVLLRSCHFCFTHFCSPSCQRSSWREHVTVCFYGRIHFHLEMLINKLKDQEMNLSVSEIGYRGYERKGRGCVFLVFSSPKRLEQLVTKDSNEFRAKPTYSTVADLTRHGVKNQYQTQLLEFISKYDPATQIIVSIAVVVGRNIPSNPVPRKKEVTVRKIVHLSLHSRFANSSVLLRESSLRRLSGWRNMDPNRRKTL